MKIDYKTLKMEELHSSIFKHFNRYQETKRVWFKENDQYIIKEDHFIEQWDDDKKIEVIEALKSCMISGGAVVGAFYECNLIGFANVEGEKIGGKAEYLELNYLHVSNEFRKLGIGKRLFELCCQNAKQMGVKKLYIAAHPSIETQHFYKSVGCTYAVEVIQRIYKKEPLDIQLEKIL